MLDDQLRNAMVQSFNNYAVGLDTKDWELLRSCFADEVLLDYGNISPDQFKTGKPSSSDAWVAHLKSVINGFDVTHHRISNHRFGIAGDMPWCKAYLAADHVIFKDPAMTDISADELSTVVGEYTNYYVQAPGGLKICRSRLAVQYSHGNAALFPEAIARAAAKEASA